VPDRLSRTTGHDYHAQRRLAKVNYGSDKPRVHHYDIYRRVAKTEPFLEDFEDENMTGWTQSGYTASNRYAQRTAADDTWRRFERSQTDADVDLVFTVLGQRPGP
jgi:hypothetical protein